MRRGGVYTKLLIRAMLCLALAIFPCRGQESYCSEKGSSGLIKADNAVSLNLPPASEKLSLSRPYSYPVLKGIKINPDNPFLIEFIVDTQSRKDVGKKEIARLIQYFLTTLTIPEDDLWVNLSLYEQDKIVPDNLGATELGRGLLSQDYILKQLSSSLVDPASRVGQDYWNRTYREIYKAVSTTNLEVNTFNKIWIVPGKAVVHEAGKTAFIVEADLNVLSEQDYLSLKNNIDIAHSGQKQAQEGFARRINAISSKVLKEVIVPEVGRDINKGQNFAQLRQIYHSVILGMWFKKKLKDSIYRYYIDREKTKGLEMADKSVKERIYKLYVDSFKKGVFDYIKSEYEPSLKKNIKRRYCSGGVNFNWSSLAKQIEIDTGEYTPVSSCITGRPKSVEIEVGALLPEAGEYAESDITLSSSLMQSRREFLRFSAAGLGALTYSLMPGWVKKASAAAAKALNAQAESFSKAQIEKSIAQDMSVRRVAAGSYLESLLLESEVEFARGNPIWDLFVYSLDSSHWLSAAKLLDEEGEFFSRISNEIDRIKGIDAKTAASAELLLAKLPELKAMHEKYSSRPGVDSWFGYGELPLFSGLSFSEDSEVEEFCKFFKEVDFLNNLFQAPALTASNVPVYLHNEHGWAYKAWKEVQKNGLLPTSDRSPVAAKKRKVTLVHIDSHVDGGSKSVSIKDLLQAKALEEFARLAKKMGIDGFIVPAMYEGLIDEMVWGIPEEAQGQDEEIGYSTMDGTYEWEAMRGTEHNQDTIYLKAPNIMLGEGEFFNRYTDKNDARKIKVHIVSASKVSRLKEILEDSTDVIFDTDEDFLGVYDRDGRLGVDFAPDEARFEELFRAVKSAYEIAKEKIRVITLARSLNFTYKGRARKITKRILDFLIDSSRSQPAWVKRVVTIFNSRSRIESHDMIVQASSSLNAEEKGKSADFTKGGIDLTAGNFDFSTSSSVQLNFLPEIAEKWKQARGIVFYIRKVSDLDNPDGFIKH